MKLVLLCYNVTVQEEVLQALQECGISSYTLWQEVLGVGSGGGPHLNSPVWPGYNCVMAIVVDAETKTSLLNRVRALRERHRKEGVKAFVLPVEEIT